MHEDWKISKEHLIKEYFSDNKPMQEIAEKAFNGEIGCQDYIADWFEKNNKPDMANAWRKKAQLARRQLGIDED